MKPKQKETKRTYRTRKLSRTASTLISRAMRSKGFAEAEVVTRWGHIAGPELAKTTVPVKLRFPRGERMNATLVVKCHSAFAPLLEHQSPRIIEQVNRYFGYRAVAKLAVVHGVVPVRQPMRARDKQPLSKQNQKTLDDLVSVSKNDEELSPVRAAVKSLGEHVLSNK